MPKEIGIQYSKARAMMRSTYESKHIDEGSQCGYHERIPSAVSLIEQRVDRVDCQAWYGTVGHVTERQFIKSGGWESISGGHTGTE